MPRDLSLLHQISERVSEFLEGRVALHELSDWIAQLMWDIDAAETPRASDLLGRIQNIFAESRSQDELKTEIEEAVRPFAASREEYVQ